jgi:hypothetical protein
VLKVVDSENDKLKPHQNYFDDKVIRMMLILVMDVYQH